MTARSLAASLAALALAGGCEPFPEPLPRIVSSSPAGALASREQRIEFTASEPFDADDVLGGARMALCLAPDLREVKRLAEDGAPLPPARIVAARAELENGGRSAVLVPEAPLVPGIAYAAVLAHGVRSAGGRLVLDPEGRPRSVVLEFTVSPDLEGPIHAELVKVLADAEAPEAGGEYVQVANLGADPLDLAGFRLAKRGPSGAFTRCTITRRAGVAAPPGAHAILVGGAYDDRYDLPPGMTVYACGASAVAGGLANDRAPALLLESPGGAPVSSIGVAAEAPRCDGLALVRVDASGPDAAQNLACSDVLEPLTSAGPGSQEGAAAR